MRTTAIALALLVACAESQQFALPLCASAELSRAVSSDRRVSLCLPDGFHASGTTGHTWVRGAATDSTYAFVTVVLLDSSERADLESWPPRLYSQARGVPDETVCESIERTRYAWRTDSITVETGLCSGGVGGWSRQPTALAGWFVKSNVYVFYQAFAYRPADLSLIRSIAQSVTVQ